MCGFVGCWHGTCWHEDQRDPPSAPGGVLQSDQPRPLLEPWRACGSPACPARMWTRVGSALDSFPGPHLADAIPLRRTTEGGRQPSQPSEGNCMGGRAWTQLSRPFWSALGFVGRECKVSGLRICSLPAGGPKAHLPAPQGLRRQALLWVLLPTSPRGLMFSSAFREQVWGGVPENTHTLIVVPGRKSAVTWG